MSGHLERICIGDRINRDHESEGARIRWTDGGCELVISFSNLKSKEIKGVREGVFELGLNADCLTRLLKPLKLRYVFPPFEVLVCRLQCRRTCKYSASALAWTSIME